MDEYLLKYPEDEQNIRALEFAYSSEKADEICKDALNKEKRISLIIDESRLDYLGYEFI